MPPSVQSSPRRAEFIDTRILMQIRSLELRSQVVVQGFWNGIHRSPYHGFSAEFTEYRQYAPGDDTRYLDWRLLARSDRFYIKKFEDETNLRCHLLLDQSRSMTFGSLDWTKADYAHTLAATLAYFLFQQGDAVGLLSFDESIRDYLPARNRPGHLRQLMLSLEKPAAGKSTDLSKPLRRIVELVNKRGLMVLVSDLLTPLDELERQLGRLTATGHEVIVFHLLDPRERDLDFRDETRFYDLETPDETLTTQPRHIHLEYREMMDNLIRTYQTSCANARIDYALLDTATLFDTALSRYLVQRKRIG